LFKLHKAIYFKGIEINLYIDKGNSMGSIKEKVTANPGNIKDNNLFFFRKWVAEPGKFEVLIGSSSRDIRLKNQFNLK